MHSLGHFLQNGKSHDGSKCMKKKSYTSSKNSSNYTIQI